MKTAELIRNDNVYRAVGGKCWLATFEVVSDDGLVRGIKPMVRKVEVIGPNGSCSGLTVQYGPAGGELSASRDAVFDDRDDANAAAVELCEAMDGRGLMGVLTYAYVRPKARKPKAPELRLRVHQPWAGAFYVEHWDASKRRWIRIHTHRLTRWKANDMVRRIKAGDDVPGFWREPGTMNWIELCDYEV
jgi:hypothetical protein